MTFRFTTRHTTADAATPVCFSCAKNNTASAASSFAAILVGIACAMSIFVLLALVGIICVAVLLVVSLLVLVLAVLIICTSEYALKEPRPIS